jgi:5-methylcytosine-specific restriction endonuclease McrA
MEMPFCPLKENACQIDGRFLLGKKEKLMQNIEIDYVKKCISDNDIHRFYIWKPWLHVRSKVLEMDRYECQDCKAKGKYTKANTVHHCNYVKKHPDLALEIWYTWRGETKRNLISLCHDCHEERHGYRKPEGKKPLTEERW